MALKHLRSFTVPALASEPATARAGMLYFDTTLGRIRYYTGTVWVTL